MLKGDFWVNPLHGNGRTLEYVKTENNCNKLLVLKLNPEI